MTKYINDWDGWIEVPNVRNIYAVSNCISKDLDDYVSAGKHNGY